LELAFINSPRYLGSLLDRKEDCPVSSLRIFGDPLIVHNILIGQNMLGIDTVCMPETFSSTSTLIQNIFPTLSVKGFHQEYRNDISGGNTENSSTVQR
jgi:hypothetical protein